MNVDPIPKVKRQKSTLLKEADQLCGRLVRARGRCEECQSTKHLQWAHGFSRSYRKVRHDLRNGFCLCQACHMRFTHNPLLWDDWLRARWGPELYAQMRFLALSGPRADLRETVSRLRVEYERTLE